MQQRKHSLTKRVPVRWTVDGDGSTEPNNNFSLCNKEKCERASSHRRRKLHIPRPDTSVRSHPFRCASSPNGTHCVGLRFGFKCSFAEYFQFFYIKIDISGSLQYTICINLLPFGGNFLGKEVESQNSGAFR